MFFVKVFGQTITRWLVAEIGELSARWIKDSDLVSRRQRKKKKAIVGFRWLAYSAK